jgi:hypothetical protein
MFSFASYRDDWLEEKYLFDRVCGGIGSGCACCGLGLSPALSASLSECTDADTDAAREAQYSAWPRHLLEPIWRDRVIFRQKLKRAIRSEWHDVDTSALRVWWAHVPLAEKRALCQMSRAALHAEIANFGFSVEFSSLLLLEVTQLEHWDELQLDSSDECGEAQAALRPHEALFIDGLFFHSAALAFFMADEYLQCDDTTADWVARLEQLARHGSLLGKPRLVRAAQHDTDSKIQDEQPVDADSHAAASETATVVEKDAGSADQASNSGGADAARKGAQPPASSSATSAPVAAGTAGSTGGGTGFRSFAADRRLLRIVIFRRFANAILRQFSTKDHMRQHDKHSSNSNSEHTIGHDDARRRRQADDEEEDGESGADGVRSGASASLASGAGSAADASAAAGRAPVSSAPASDAPSPPLH